MKLKDKEEFYPYWSVISCNLAGYGSTPTAWVNSEEKAKELRE